MSKSVVARPPVPTTVVAPYRLPTAFLPPSCSHSISLHQVSESECRCEASIGDTFQEREGHGRGMETGAVRCDAVRAWRVRYGAARGAVR